MKRTARRGVALTFAFTLGALAGAGGMFRWMSIPVTYTDTATVIDGDTIVVQSKHIRFVGINTPELPTNPKKCRRYLERPECTDAASAQLSDFLQGKVVSCTEVGQDFLGRSLAICYAGGTEIAQWLIERCLAHSPLRRQHRIPRYEAMIAAAVASGKCQPDAGRR